MTEEAAEEFKSSLVDLTFNSKPLINMLTMLAEDNAQYAEQIVNVIEEHVKLAASSHKLPALYLIDSIIKNIPSSNYLQLFTKNIVHNFVLVFEKVDEKTRQAMFKLRQTWTDLFPNKKLFTLDVRVNHIDPAWPVTAQPPQIGTTSIHVNPKFLLKQSTDLSPVSPVSTEPDPFSYRLDEKRREDDGHREPIHHHGREDEDQKLQQQMVAKEDLEQLRLEQQRLEKALAEARARLDEQAKILRSQPAGGQMSSSLTTANTMSPALSSNQSVAGAKVSLAVAPCARDPRVAQQATIVGVSASRVDPRLGGAHQTAVVLPTVSVDTPLQPPAVTSVSVSSDNTGLVRPIAGNIFDRLQNLVPAKTPSPTPLATMPLQSAASSAELTSAALAAICSAVGVDRLSLPNQVFHRTSQLDTLTATTASAVTVNADVDFSKANTLPMAVAAADIEVACRVSQAGPDTQLQSMDLSDTEASLKRDVDNDSMHTSMSDVAVSCDTSTPANIPPRPSKSSSRSKLPRSPKRSTAGVGKTSKRSPTERDGGDKLTLSQTQCSSKMDDTSPKSRRRGSVGRRRTSSTHEYGHKMVGSGTKSHSLRLTQPNSDHKEKDGGPAAKKMKHVTVQNDELSKGADSSMGLPNDLAELFGKEDVDYRHLPTIPKLQPPPLPPLSPHRPPLLGPAPASTSTWTNFKSDHPPGDFLMDASDVMTAKHMKRNASDLELRKKHPLLPTPDLVDDHMRSIRDQELSLDRHRLPHDSTERPVKELSPLRVGFGPRLEESRLPGRHLDKEGHRQSPRPVAERSPCYEGPHETDRKGFYDREEKVLLPTPVVPHLPLPPPPRPMGSRRDVGNVRMDLWDAPVKHIFYDEELFYVPEYDVRWWMRAKMSDHISNTYNVVIDGRGFSMMLDSRPCRINIGNRHLVIGLDSKSRQLIIDGIGCYRFGSPPKEVNIRGQTYRVYVHGPEKKLWIDDHLFEINIDGPPEKINIGGKVHEVRIDSATNYVIVDDYNICHCDADETQTVTLAFVLHSISFKAPKKEILIDGKHCTLDLSGKFPVIWIDGRAHGIRFDGEPRYIFIDDNPYLVPVDWARKCRIDGPKPRLLAFGGPGHEVIIDDQWFEVKFNGAEKFIKFGGSTHKVFLKGNPPEVKILPEVVLLNELRDRTSGTDRGTFSSQRIPPPGVVVASLRTNYEQQQRDFRNDFPVSASRLQSVQGGGLRHPCVDTQRGLVGKDASRNSPMRFVPQAPHAPDTGFLDHRSTSAPFLNCLDDRPNATDPARSHLPETSSWLPQQEAVQPLTNPAYDRPRGLRLGQSQVEDGNSVYTAMHGSERHYQQQPYQYQPQQQTGSTGPAGAGMGLQAGGIGFGAQPVGMYPAADAADSWPSGVVSQTTSLPSGIDVNLLLQQLLAKGLIGQQQQKATPAAAVACPVQEGVAVDPLVPQQAGTLATGQTTVDLPPVSMAALTPAATLETVTKVEKDVIKESEVDEQVETIPQICDFVMDDLRKRYLGAIQQLYVGISCSSCGVRFKSDAMDSYNEHLDWHFRQNRYEKEGMKVARYRRWYYDVVDWVQFEEIVDLDEKAQAGCFETETPLATSSGTNLMLPECLSKIPNVISCPEASGNDKEDICDICRESFEQFWNEEHEAWHLKDAVSVSGKIYHPVCFEDAKECFLNESMTGDRTTNEPLNTSLTTEVEMSSPPAAVSTDSTDIAATCNVGSDRDVVNAENASVNANVTVELNSQNTSTDVVDSDNSLLTDIKYNSIDNTAGECCGSDVPVVSSADVKVLTVTVPTAVTSPDLVATSGITDGGRDQSVTLIGEIKLDVDSSVVKQERVRNDGNVSENVGNLVPKGPANDQANSEDVTDVKVKSDNETEGVTAQSAIASDVVQKDFAEIDKVSSTNIS